jgi:hypothetical protein
MAEVTSGANLTVIVLDEREAAELAGILHGYYFDNLGADDNGWPLYALYDALVPTEDDEPARRCACGYELDGYKADEDMCGACLDNPVAFFPVGGAA